MFALKNILVADDHPIVTSGVSDILTNHFRLSNISFVHNGIDLMDYIQKNKEIDLFIVDISMPHANIFEIVKVIKKYNRRARIIIYSMLSSKTYEHRLINLGVDAYVEKSQSIHQLKLVLQSLMLGKDYAKTKYSINKRNNKSLDTSMPFQMLSNRELLIVEYMAGGDTNTTIAKKMNLKQSTIGTYKSRIFEKLRIGSVVDLLELMDQFHLT